MVQGLDIMTARIEILNARWAQEDMDIALEKHRVDEHGFKACSLCRPGSYIRWRKPRRTYQKVRDAALLR